MKQTAESITGCSIFLLAAVIASVLLIPAVASTEKTSLTDKTLVVWVSPANLTQRGGSALTVNDTTIDRFDGVVFAELENSVWMPGSSNYSRTHKEQSGWLCLATLRPDGWAGYEPIDNSQPATVLTQPMICSGKALRVTADARVGAVTVAVLDIDGRELAISIAITNDVTAAEVQWQDGFDLATLTGQSVGLRFELKTARIYSFDFITK